jgi:hypothetical protein
MIPMPTVPPDASPSRPTVGSHGAYQWLTTDCPLDELLRLRPSVVLEKYVAITAEDSGAAEINGDEECQWKSHGGILYSRAIDSVDCLLNRGIARCGSFNEWYVFENPKDLGSRVEGNIFEAALGPGEVHIFVNFLGFCLDDSSFKDLADLFWKQLEWIWPESYLAEGSDCATFVSRNKREFAGVAEQLNRLVK